MGMVTFKMKPASLLPASMAIPGMVVEKGEDGEVGAWSGHCHPSKPGVVQSFLTVDLEHGRLLLREAI